MYKCIACDKSFKSNRTLKNHLKSEGHNFRVKNPQLLFLCICGRSFQYKQGLSRHKRECSVVLQEKTTNKCNTNEITKLREENKQLQEKLDAMMTEPKVINNNTTNNNSQQNPKQRDHSNQRGRLREPRPYHRSDHSRVYWQGFQFHSNDFEAHQLRSGASGKLEHPDSEQKRAICTGLQKEIG